MFILMFDGLMKTSPSFLLRELGTFALFELPALLWETYDPDLDPKSVPKYFSLCEFLQNQT